MSVVGTCATVFEAAARPDSPRARTRKRVIAVVGIALVVASLIMIPISLAAIDERLRVSEFEQLVRADPNSTLHPRLKNGDLTAVFRNECGKIEDGWTRDMVIQIGDRNWSAIAKTSDSSKEVHMNNLVAFHEAALLTCR